MNRLMKSVTAFVAALAMIAAPLAEAQGRGRQSHTSGAPASSQNTSRRPSTPGNGASRPNRPSTPSNGSHNRPGNNGGNSRPEKPGNNTRPMPPGNGSGSNRPGNPGHGHGPGPGANNRPSHPGNPGHGPGYGRPGHTVGPNDYRPRPGYHRPPAPPRPPRIPYGYRHPVPFFGAYHRPLPPPSWNRYYAGPTFGTILGVALGTTLDLSLNALLNSGYTVTNYGPNVVYLTNVPQMNLLWPNAAMYYNNGLLCGSQFTYPSPYYDMQRYNLLYGQLVGQFGAPVEQYNNGGVISATWFGAGNRFVTLEFNNTGGQYYTTLSFGN
jgi:hypothetical protein